MTNNDFAFKDVHNEELFYQNGKILVEVVQLFENFRIIGSKDLQLLGNLFEQLLNKGFKQNEGQFFTPIPITRFIWNCLPLKEIIEEKGQEFPRIIDYACGAGHFLTEGFEATNDAMRSLKGDVDSEEGWAEHNLFGIEKDYRLARVSKISLFMHGAGDGNIIFGDGLENYKDKGIEPFTFDILVANPPYSVKAFKPHLNLKDNRFETLQFISNTGSEIETLFVERISQLLKPKGVAAVILPVTILNKDNSSFISAREKIIENFEIKAIVLMGKNTFGETGQPTAILYLQKYDEPPKRMHLVSDSVEAILDVRDLSEWEDNEILNGYSDRIGVSIKDYYEFVMKKKDYDTWKEHEYFNMYYNGFIASSEYSNKVKQKTFNKMDIDEQISWKNEHFYEYAISIEAEKLRMYALCYKQDVVVVNAPDEKKEEEAFLGYKWNGRKGQEGIDIVKDGGELYDPNDRYSNEYLSSIIRESYKGNEIEIERLNERYYLLRLQDMVDFSQLNFTKVIKTAKTRPLKTTPGLVNYKLSDKKRFIPNIGNRVVSTEIENEGIPIISANVYEEFGKISKFNIDDFSLPSVIWGIDGDWMVNYIAEKTEFYPTDHCGYMRIKEKNINPLYFALALQVEGEYERYSRSNRASVQRIKSLTIQIPEIKVQKKIIDELRRLAEDIHYERISITEIDNKTRKLLVDYLGDICSKDTIIEKLLRIVR